MTAELELPALLGPVQKLLRAGGAVHHGRPVLRDGTLRQRRGVFVRDVDLRDAVVELVPRRPGTLLLCASAPGKVEVELLRVRDMGGRSRTPAELEALADALGEDAAPIAKALFLPAAYTGRNFSLPNYSPLAPYAGKPGTLLGDIGDVIGSLHDRTRLAPSTGVTPAPHPQELRDRSTSSYDGPSTRGPSGVQTIGSMHIRRAVCSASQAW